MEAAWETVMDGRKIRIYPWTEKQRETDRQSGTDRQRETDGQPETDWCRETEEHQGTDGQPETTRWQGVNRQPEADRCRKNGESWETEVCHGQNNGQENSAPLPVVYANMFIESGAEVLAEYQKLNGSAFHFVTVSNLRWNDDLSPWYHGAVMAKGEAFGGKADEYLDFFTGQVMPYAEEKLGNVSARIIAGYSMAGLFALYAPHRTTVFDSVVAASASVWYPGVTDYVKKQDFSRKPEAVYLSIGDREARTKNPYLRESEHCMEELCSLYRERQIPVVFERNQGNHYQNAPLRLAKGIKWALAEKEGTKSEA